jgi:transposase
MSMDYVGIDVSKHHLDLAISDKALVRIANTAEGIARLIEQLSQLDRPHVVCESTGSHTRLLARELGKGRIALSVINPRRVRELARASGQLAKTDAIDAGMILRFAQLMQPEPSPPPQSQAVELADLVRRRRQLVDMLAMEKQRTEHPEAGSVQASLKAHIAFLAGQVRDLDAAIGQQIEGDAELRRRADLLISVPGIGQTTAAVLVADLPELGQIDKKAIAALAGVAPFTRESGQFRGQAHIAGGRASVRCALYMATISAIRANPPLKSFYRRLRDNGKPAKLAIVAAMRKLLITANAIIATGRPWQPEPQSKPQQP